MGKTVGSIDLGVINIVALTFDSGQRPILYQHKPWRDDLNRYQALSGKAKPNKKDCRELHTLTKKLNQAIYKICQQVAKDCVFNEVQTVIIGWTSPNATQQPLNPYYAKVLSNLLGQLRQKLHQKNIQTVLVDEAYTSQMSCLDLDEVTLTNTSQDLHLQVFSGQRVERDTYLTKTNQRIQADVNSSYNIMLRSQESSRIKPLIESAIIKPRIIKPYVTHIK